jgi:gliding motility-associated-like protein
MVASSTTISVADTTVCSGLPVSFTVSTTGSASDPTYQWEVNGSPTGTDSDSYTGNALVNGDRISCIVSDSSACLSSLSNILTMTVFNSPTVDPGQPITITQGHGVVLHPVITGTIENYTWIPPAGLSNPMIPDPVADPVKSIVYTLQVVSTDGCKASGQLEVTVSAPFRLPNAFTPNGDGKNDVFYVLSGPAGSRIGQFSIFDRWGQRVFRVEDGIPGDRSVGWNGNVNGKPGMAGAYIYQVTLVLADGRTEGFQGSFLLIR